MNREQDWSGENPQMDMELEQALKHFKASVDAWSDAAYSRRPRTAAKMAVRHSWRMLAGWALGCLLVMGSLAGAAREIYQRQEMARIAAQKAAQKIAEERAAAARVTAQPVGVQTDKKTPAATTRKASTTMDSAEAQDEDLLASVDSDVSREVPAAMEPLARLMDDNGTE
jgi:uncharacterized membrane protein YdfJ with MMPL/SSD domain